MADNEQPVYYVPARPSQKNGWLNFTLAITCIIAGMIAVDYLGIFSARDVMDRLRGLGAAPLPTVRAIQPPAQFQQPQVIIPAAPPSILAPTVQALYPEPPRGARVQPAPPVEAPGESAPAGAPLTDQQKAIINAQQRTNANGEVCAPRSGCTKPGSGGPLAWPMGRP